MGFFRYVRDESGEKTHFCIGKLKIKIDKSGANYYNDFGIEDCSTGSNYSSHGIASGPSFNINGTPMLSGGSSIDVSGKSYGSK